MEDENKDSLIPDEDASRRDGAREREREREKERNVER